MKHPRGSHIISEKVMQEDLESKESRARLNSSFERLESEVLGLGLTPKLMESENVNFKSKVDSLSHFSLVAQHQKTKTSLACSGPVRSPMLGSSGKQSPLIQMHSDDLISSEVLALHLGQQTKAN